MNQILTFLEAGDIHIWDQESGALLHQFRAQALGGDLTCIAWNHAADNPFMFATGSHDGAVRIWTKPPDEPKSAGREYLSVPVNGHVVVRTSSPFELDMDRTDSPVKQQDSESHHWLDEHTSSQEGRTVSFVT